MIQTSIPDENDKYKEFRDSYILKSKNIIDNFQAPDNINKILIGNLTVCSTGIDLDDKWKYKVI